VLRCITKAYTPELFSTFAPKALGMIGRKMPDTTLTRSVFVEMKRKKKDENVQQFEHKDDPELRDLRSRLLRFSLDNGAALERAKPAMPDEFDNRDADNWRLQFAIADLCSTGVEDWGQKARDAAKSILKGSDSRTGTDRLLAAIKAVFDSIRDKDDDDVAGSQELCDKLAADPEFPELAWALWRKSRKSITQHALARLLKPLRIFPDQVRPKKLNGDQIRGYARSQFEDAWSRYL
jgi:hypothetical protein